MKKIISAVLVAAMGMSLMACGSTEEGTKYDKIEVETFDLPTEAEESEIYVNKIEGLPEDFFRGVDVSEVLAEENSGVVYKAEDGTEQDVFKTLAQAGVNYVRIRIWNDPYDADGNGYGGGNCDLDTAITLGRRATAYGMKVLIDFHYSDFWADPTRQLSPKAWADMTADEKSEALYTFTYDSLTALLDAGVDVGMVQIGNETNFGMAGETNLTTVASLMEQGCSATRKVSEENDHEIKTVIHYTNPGNTNQIQGLLDILQENNVDYDILGLSYYIYWHGEMDKVAETMSMIQNDYGKQCMIVETSYPYTLEDGDGASNSVSETDLIEGYSASVQGQSSVIQDICRMTYENGGLGVFYWGGIWCPVNAEDGNNAKLWQKYGSGWASRFAKDYDPENVGNDYGGCAWDNQALFDFNGQALASLSTFKYLYTGTICEEHVECIDDFEYDIPVGQEVSMPETIPVMMNTGNYEDMAVTWNEEDVSAIDTSEEASFTVNGTTESGDDCVCIVNVGWTNLAENVSFEDDDYSMWDVTYEGSSDPTDYQDNAQDAHSGDIAFHYWSEDDMDFSISQTVDSLEAGTYGVSVYSQGGDFSADSVCQLFVSVNGGEEQTADFENAGWVVWQHPEILKFTVAEGDTVTFGVHITCNAKAWGTLDDFSLFRME